MKVKTYLSSLIAMLALTVGLQPLAAKRHDHKEQSKGCQQTCKSHHSSKNNESLLECCKKATCQAKDIAKCCSKVKREVREINQKQFCQFVITADDINDASTSAGFLITEPGVYCLSEQVDWKSAIQDGFAITIASNDVVLSGNGHTIKQLNTNVRHAFVIQVQVGSQNVKIQDIVLEGGSGGAIYVAGNNKRLVLDSVTTINCGYFGPTTLDTNIVTFPTFPAWSAAVLFNGGSPTNDNAGLRPISEVVIVNCNFFDTGFLGPITNPTKFEGQVSPILTVHTSEISITHTNIIGCFGDNRAWGISHWGRSGATPGSLPDLVDRTRNGLWSELLVQNVISHNLAKGVWTRRFDDLQFQDSNIQEIDVELVRNLTGAFPDSIIPGAEGAKIETPNLVMQRVNFTDIKCYNRPGTGPWTIGPNPADPVLTLACYGLLTPAGNVRNVLVEDCTCTNVSMGPNIIMNRLPDIHGFMCNTSPLAKSQINRCHVSNMQSPVGPVSGFVANGTAGSTNNNIANCVAEFITHLPGGTGTATIPHAYGFFVTAKDNVLLGNEANNITSTDPAGQAYGIRLSTTADNAIISGNRVIKCVAPNNPNANTSAGIRDDSVLQNSTFDNNYAAFNGPGGTVNFIPATLTAGTPIQNWIVPGLPAAPVAGKLDNINRRNP